ncbi:glycerate kinase family protein [Gephyromycinifex aptenodytis]|uniref:glycerate kinase family protein n=1 Tax=Gephyromycinifex aptenodytis TaxID=2716227 RepID=UPI001444FEB0|nr:glycerate kinase [Gephyromycinifex aptenodytis]
MRVLICPEAFAGMLTAVQTAEAMASGWRQRAPHDELTLTPLASGGPGFLHVLEEAHSGMAVALTVSDPLGRSVPAQVLLVEEAGRRTAYIESAQAAGIHLLSAAERDPASTSTYGVGQLVLAAVEEGAQRIVLGVGGSATTDAGAGFLAALGAGDPAVLARGGMCLGDIADDALSELPLVLHRLSGVELVLATDHQIPLLGFEGTCATTAQDKGASPQGAQQLEAALGRFTEVVARTLPAPTDLLTGLPRRVDRELGAGAGGGLGYAMLALGALRQSAVSLVQQAWGFESLLARHDLLLTGEGCFDWTSLRASTVAEVTARAAERALPTIILAGQVQVGRRESMAMGAAGVYAVADTPADVLDLAADPVGRVRARAARIAATWSPS